MAGPGSTVIKRCVAPWSCKSDFQDQRYGAGNRVMNKKKSNSATCTVCGRDQSHG